MSTRIIPLSKWNDFHPWPTVSALRNMMLNAEKTGFDRVIRRLGKRIIILEDQFFDWIRSKELHIK